MDFNEQDIANLNKIIHSIHSTDFDNIPEIFMGFQRFPMQGSREDLIYRIYEDFLIDNNFCSLKWSHWTPNSTISGYKPLKLESKGMVLIVQQKSIAEFLN